MLKQKISGSLKGLMSRRGRRVSSFAMDRENMNPQVIQCEYAVRGNVLLRSMEIEKELKDPTLAKKYPFDEITPCNIGNPHALHQPALTFHRQVLSGCLNPALVQMKRGKLFPTDVCERVTKYMDPSSMPGGMGAYSNSQGMPAVRKEVAEFITSRDGHPADPSNIFLTNGASEGVRFLTTALLNPHEKEGLLTPIPQYPLYSATLTLLGSTLVPYYLDESQEWSVTKQSLQQALVQAKEDGVRIRGVCVLNPGNPTGNILSREDIEGIIELAVQENIVVFADEVYQENIWRSDRSFHSFKKVASDMGVVGPVHEECELQLVSFHSVSKGYIGECGIRGGYFELVGFPKFVREQIYKLSSVSLCSNTPGQIMMGLMVNPPKEGEESYELFEQERKTILGGLLRKSKMLYEALNQMENVSCNFVEGALYAFPRVVLPKKAVAKAAERGVAADEYYCLEILQDSGIVMVPGSGFGQQPGTYHFRLTFLPEESKMPKVLKLLADAHAKFMQAHA